MARDLAAQLRPLWARPLMTSFEDTANIPSESPSLTRSEAGNGKTNRRMAFGRAEARRLRRRREDEAERPSSAQGQTHRRPS